MATSKRSMWLIMGEQWQDMGCDNGKQLVFLELKKQIKHLEMVMFERKGIGLGENHLYVSGNGVYTPMVI